MKQRHHLLLLVAMLVPTLACQAVMRLVDGREPGPAVSPPSTPAPAASAPSPNAPASCPAETRAIVQAANSESVPTSRFPRVETTNSIDVPLVTYEVQGDKLSAPILERPVPDDLLPYQEDFASQQSAWHLFTQLIPGDQRSMLTEFRIMTDGPSGVLSAVEQTANDPDKWVLEIDIADIPDTRNLAFTLLHEFGHLLTLSAAQVPPDLNVFNDPNNTRVLDKAVAACSTYFPGEGCSLSSSYVNEYFQQFWTQLYAEWSAIEKIPDDNRHDARLRSFYRKYQDQFVDSYAVTSPVEDIAETWAYFVLSPRPDSTSIADQKIDFFYGFPELISLRQQVLSGLCASNP